MIDPKPHTGVAYAETTYEAWENLRKRYIIANAPKIHQLKIDISLCKQGGLEVAEFYSKLMQMCSELENHLKIPQCKCGKCECRMSNKVVKMMNEETTHQFLMEVNEETFSSIHSQVLTLELLPSIDFIFNMITQEENHKNLMSARDLRSKHMVAFASREQTNERPSCKHWGRRGHDDSQLL